MRRFPPIAFLLAACFACSGGGGSGCGGSCAGLGTIPDGGWYVGPKLDNPVDVRLSPAGIDFVNQNFMGLVDLLAPGGNLNVSIPCTISNVSGLGNVAIADQGNVGTRQDGVCSPGEGADVAIVVNSFSLVPTPPDKVSVTVNVTINTGPIYIDPVSRCDSICCLGLGFITNDCGGSCCCGACVFGACVGIGTSGVVKCSVDFNDTGPGNTLAANVQFTINNTWDKLLAFNVSLAGTDICGASGAPPAPECLDPNALNLSSAGGCNIGNGACDVANWGPIKSIVLQLLSPTLQSKIQGLIGTQECETCGSAGDLPCHQLPPATSTCTGGVCLDTAGNCLPRFLGLQGRLDLGSVLGAYGSVVPPTAKVDLSLALGSSVSVDTGINIGTRAGLNAVGTANCVPAATLPTPAPLAAPDFDGNAPDGGAYHVAIGASDDFLNLAMFQVEQSGGLCLQVGSADFGVINTGLFKTFLPSLGLLATRDGNDAPMLIALQPSTPPTVTVGAGTFDPVTQQPIAPLLDIQMKALNVDFYAMFDDRYARLFRLTADVDLPLSLQFEGCDQVTPALGSLSTLITNVHVSPSEILAEDPTVLQQLIPAILSIAQPALAGVLKPINLPSLGAFKLQVDAAKGIEPSSTRGPDGGTAYDFLALYAQLLPSSAQCAVGAPTVAAQLERSVIPSADQMRAPTHALPLPAAVLRVDTTGIPGTPEYSYRVDRGFWTVFRRADGPNALTIASPAFLIQGRHTIEVRSRVAEQPRGISAPAAVGFLVDWDPPVVSLSVNRGLNRLEVKAHDVLTPDSALKYAYKVGPDGAWSEYGPAREIDLSAVEDAGGLEVHVQDEAGNVGSAAFRAATTVSPMAAASGGGKAGLQEQTNAGCAAGPGGLALLALVAWARRRRG